jgi:hypothetical protein
MWKGGLEQSLASFRLWLKEKERPVLKPSFYFISPHFLPTPHPLHPNRQQPGKSQKPARKKSII